MFNKVVKQKAIVNIITSLLYQFVSTSLGLVLPYLLISGLGSESNGLLGSIGQLFTCLGLLEAGIGTVSLQAFYKPIASDDYSSINSILSASDKYYKKAGYLYTIGIILIAVIYPYAVDSLLPSWTIRLVIVYQGICTLIGYFNYRKYLNLLKAEGKNFIINIIMIIEIILRNFGKIIAINKGYDVATVQFIQLLSTCIEALLVNLYVNRKYKWIDRNATPDFNALSQKKSAMTQYVAWMVFNHTDILVLTFFTRNLAVVSVYTVYLMVFEAVQNISNAFRESFQYKLGRIAQRPIERLGEYYDKYSSAVSAITNALYVIAYILCDSFIRLYTKNVNDVQYLLIGVSELFMIYKILYSSRAVNRQLIEVIGCFKDTQHIPVIEAALNLFISIILVPFYGIYGVLIGTIIALVYSVLAHIRYIGIRILDNQAHYLYIQQVTYLLPALLAIIIRRNISLLPNNYYDMLTIGSITFFIVVPGYYFVYRLEHKISSYCNNK